MLTAVDMRPHGHTRFSSHAPVFAPQRLRSTYFAHLIAMNKGYNGYGKQFKSACNELGLYRYGHKVE